MSRRDFEPSLASDIFGASMVTPEDDDHAVVPTAPRSESAPIPQLLGVLPDMPHMAVFREVGGNVVVRDYTPRPAVDALSLPSIAPPVSSEISINLQKNGGDLSGHFRLKGEFAALLGSLAAQTNQPLSNHQLESGIAPESTRQPVVDSTPSRSNERQRHSENDLDLTDNVAKKVATRGLGRVLKSVVRPRITTAVLALSAVTAGGAYYALSDGELPIRPNLKDTIQVLKADYNQLIHHPIQTVIAQTERLQE